MCPVCFLTIELVDHIFASCRELVDIWSRIFIWWNIQTPNHFSAQSIISWSESTSLRGGQRKAFEAVIFTALWSFRNSVVFGMALPRKSNIFDDIVHRAFFLISNRCIKEKISRTSWLHSPSSATILL